MPPITSPRRTAGVPLAGLAASLTLTGCGFDAPTLRPHTQSFGTNVDAPGVKVRDLLVVARPDGRGVVSASLQADEDNELSDLAARPLLGDDSPGEPLSVRGDRVALPAGELVVLSDQPNPIVLGGDFGTDTNIGFTLVFVSGATIDVIAPRRLLRQPRVRHRHPGADPHAHADGVRHGDADTAAGGLPHRLRRFTDPTVRLSC